jgi:hypothetical protein
VSIEHVDLARQELEILPGTGVSNQEPLAVQHDYFKINSLVYAHAELMEREKQVEWNSRQEREHQREEQWQRKEEAQQQLGLHWAKPEANA